MKKKYLMFLGSIVITVAVVLLALAQVRSVRSGPGAFTPTPTYVTDTSQLNPNGENVLPAMPTAKQPTVIDLAPHIPYEDKPSVVVQHADGSREMFLVAPDLLDAFLKNLPNGDTLKLIIPPPSMLGSNEPPTATPEP